MDVFIVDYRYPQNSILANRISFSQIHTIESKTIINHLQPTMCRLDHWEFIFLESGNLCIINDDNEIQLNENEIYFFSPTKRHGYYCPNGSTPSTIITCRFFFHGNEIGKFHEYHTELTSIEKKFLNKMCANTNKPISKLITVNNNSETYDFSNNKQSIHSNFSLLLASLLERMPSHSKSPMPDMTFTIEKKEESNKTLTDQIISYLKNNIYHHISLENISNELNYSVSWIKTNFKSEVGISIIEYFNKIKIDKAKELLKMDIKIGKVADILNFCDHAYFNRLFKKHTGLTPSEYRKMFLNQEI